ncbi:hypothetical protein ACFWNK_13665 [Streptomyces sp. NPDC058417]|uniref:hypothetical protein n=1 Tax=unclassified Streptomyces TaxID=2593676 RepID=UPI0036637C68
MADDAVERPVPPPFMWGCGACVRSLLRLAGAWGAPGGCFWEQVQVARHLAEAHPDAVPAPHLEGCGVCPEYALRPDADADVWAQHRARDLFLPPSVARLL